jgi:DNA (cytosine-5)-methyltransferase 1
MGLHRAGFRNALAVEWDKAAVDTIESNRRRHTRGWVVSHEDVAKLDYGSLKLGVVDLLSAGAPCQPFSVGGRLRGEGDPRNMFPEVVRAVREIRPRTFLFENVRGLLFPRNRKYFDYILAQLRMPSRVRGADEDWMAHLAALEAIAQDEHEYTVEWRLLNAADFGLAQLRLRIVVVGVHRDEHEKFEWPAPSHDRATLIKTLYEDEYWDSHGVDATTRGAIRATLPPEPLEATTLPRWVTLRDVISDLGAPGGDDPSHSPVPGARLYPRHKGSILDWPGKTVKAGVHGCPGGEHIVLLDDGSHRYLTVRECSTLQGFPKDFNLPVLRTLAMRQIGNAVPVALSEAVGRQLKKVVTS